MKNINIDFKLDVKNFLDQTSLFFKTFKFFIKEDFLIAREDKAHNILNHIENFKEKIKLNQLQENSRRFQKYDIHYVNFGINIGNEINGIRPCLIYKSNRDNWGYDIFVIPMTGLDGNNGTEKILDKFDIKIIPDQNNKLKKSSILKLRHMKSISKKRIEGRIGKLDNIEDDQGIKLYDQIDGKIKGMFGIK